MLTFYFLEDCCEPTTQSLIIMPRYTKSQKEGLKIETILGLTSFHNSAHSTDLHQNLILYAAGCFVVIFNSSENRQMGFLQCSKPVASLQISEDGSMIAAGERGHQPSTVVWDATTHEELFHFKGHRYGVGSLCFSPQGDLLVTCGFKPDKTLLMWDLMTGEKVAKCKISPDLPKGLFHRLFF